MPRPLASLWGLHLRLSLQTDFSPSSRFGDVHLVHLLQLEACYMPLLINASINAIVVSKIPARKGRCSQL